MDKDFGLKVLEEINKVRQQPQLYSIQLRNAKKKFYGKNLELEERTIETTEGAVAYEEAAHFLDGMDAIIPLTASPLLVVAAKEALSLYLSNPSNFKDVNVDEIILKCGDVHGEYANQLEYGSDTPQMVVMNLLADDGDKNRTNRDILLNPALKVVGIVSGLDNYDKRITVLFFATLYKELSEEQKEMNKVKNKIDNELPPGVKKLETEEKIIEENGKQKKIIKIKKTMEDGTIQTEISKEDV